MVDNLRKLALKTDLVSEVCSLISRNLTVSVAGFEGGIAPAGDGSGAFRCLVCATLFSSKQTAIRHYREIHLQEMDNVSCYICQSSFKRKRHLNSHLLHLHGITQQMLKNKETVQPS